MARTASASSSTTSRSPIRARSGPVNWRWRALAALCTRRECTSSQCISKYGSIPGKGLAGQGGDDSDGGDGEVFVGHCPGVGERDFRDSLAEAFAVVVAQAVEFVDAGLHRPLAAGLAFHDLGRVDDRKRLRELVVGEL